MRDWPRFRARIGAEGTRRGIDISAEALVPLALGRLSVRVGGTRGLGAYGAILVPVAPEEARTGGGRWCGGFQGTETAVNVLQGLHDVREGGEHLGGVQMLRHILGTGAARDTQCIVGNFLG